MSAKRSQYLSYEMIEKLQLSAMERSVLQLIWSKPHFLMSKLNDMGAKLRCSGRTVQRAIKSLVEKGIVVRTYTTGKIQRLVLATMAVQKEIAKNGFGITILKRAFTKSGHDKGVVSDTTSVSHPIKSSNKELAFNRGANLKPRFFDIEKAKAEFLAKAEAIGIKC